MYLASFKYLKRCVVRETKLVISDHLCRTEVRAADRQGEVSAVHRLVGLSFPLPVPTAHGPEESAADLLPGRSLSLDRTFDYLAQKLITWISQIHRRSPQASPET